MQEFLNYLKDMLLWIPLQIYKLLLEGLEALINAIPVPEYMQNIGTYTQSIPSGITYWTDPFNIGYGVAAILAAYVLRFIIRRIPFIG
jgi:hypothetical protein